MLLFLENLDNQVLMQRAQARARQIVAAKAARRLGGQRGVRDARGRLVAAPVANIDASYYFSRMFEEREANPARAESGENVWDDPDFLPYELKHNEALRPILDRTGAPVFFASPAPEAEPGGAIVAAGKYAPVNTH